MKTDLSRAGINKNVTNRQTDRQNLPIIYRLKAIKNVKEFAM